VNYHIPVKVTFAMRKTFAPVDDLLIERLFQPASDLIAHWIGLSRSTAACVCIDIASLGWIASRAGGLSTAVNHRNAGDALLDFSLLLLGLVALTSLRTLFRRAAGQQENPLRLSMQPHRAVVLLMLVARLVQFQTPSLAEAADLAMLVFAVSALYLGACAERPPIRRSWLAAQAI
jgi:hypothetical protein